MKKFLLLVVLFIMSITAFANQLTEGKYTFSTEDTLFTIITHNEDGTTEVVYEADLNNLFQNDAQSYTLVLDLDGVEYTVVFNVELDSKGARRSLSVASAGSDQ